MKDELSGRAIQINARDNVAVARDLLRPGEILGQNDAEIRVQETIQAGHKVALVDIPQGGTIIRYGERIGHASIPIHRGEWIHTHNVESDSRQTRYEYCVDSRPTVVADLGRSARASGCAAVAIMPPYFYELPQADLVEFFVRSGEAAGLPVLLYNFPERTGTRIELETIAQVADRIPLAGIKHSGADAAYLPALIGLGREKNFVVFSGADTQIAEGMALGTAGCVGGLANIVPDLMVQIFDAVRAGFPERATRAADRVRQLGEMIDRLHFPLNVAAGMEARNLPVGQPKAICSAATLAAYQRLVTDVRNLLRQWNLVE